MAANSCYPVNEYTLTLRHVSCGQKCLAYRHPINAYKLLLLRHAMSSSADTKAGLRNIIPRLGRRLLHLLGQTSRAVNQTTENRTHGQRGVIQGNAAPGNGSDHANVVPTSIRECVGRNTSGPAFLGTVVKCRYCCHSQGNNMIIASHYRTNPYLGDVL